MLDTYVGQERAIAQLKAEIHSAKAGASRLPHMLFLGPPGSGKTTLARVMADEMRLPFEVLHCPNASDRESVTSKIMQAQGGILFCEEIHALPRLFAEDMFTVIDDNAVTMQVEITKPVERHYIKRGSIPSIATRIEYAPTGRYEMRTATIRPVTVVGATTDEAMLPAAFLSRLSALTVRLEPYDIETLRRIAIRHAWDAHTAHLTWQAAQVLATRSRENPRRLKQLVDRAYAHMVGHAKYSGITVENALTAVDLLGIDKYGLEEPHRKVLQILAESPVSRTTLAQKMGIPAKNFDLYFSELMRLGMVTIGRKHEITEKGREVVG